MLRNGTIFWVAAALGCEGWVPSSLLQLVR